MHNTKTENPPRTRDDVDVTLIRWMLSMTPAERLKALQQYVNFVLRMRAANNSG
jgi:hypothetical protein